MPERGRCGRERREREESLCVREADVEGVREAVREAAYRHSMPVW
jgi:hypothetical protein